MGEIAVHKQGWGFSGIPGKGKHKIGWVFLQRVLLTGLGGGRSALSHAGCAAPLPLHSLHMEKNSQSIPAKSFPKQVGSRALQKPRNPFLTFIITCKIKLGTRCTRFSKARPAPAAHPPASRRRVLHPPRIPKWGNTEELRASDLAFPAGDLLLFCEIMQAVESV